MSLYYVEGALNRQCVQLTIICVDTALITFWEMWGKSGGELHRGINIWTEIDN